MSQGSRPQCSYRKVPCIRSSTTPASPDYQQCQCLYSSNQAPGVEHRPIIIITNNNLPGVRILLPPWWPQNMLSIQGSVPLLQQSGPLHQGMQISSTPERILKTHNQTSFESKRPSHRAPDHPGYLATSQIQPQLSTFTYQYSMAVPQRRPCPTPEQTYLSQAQTPSQC